MGRVIYGDALSVIETLDDGSVDTLISDIPYGVNINKSWDKHLPAEDLWNKCYEKLKPGSHCVIFGQPSMNQALMSVMSNTKFEFRDMWIWQYQGTHTKGIKLEEGGTTYRSMIRNVYNPIYVFRKKIEGSELENWKKYRTNLIDIDSVREPYQGDHSSITKAYEKTGKKHTQSDTPSNTFASLRQKGWLPDPRGREPVNVKYVPRVDRIERTINGKVNNKHETVKPIRLMLWLIKMLSREKQLVLDPFCGSGTTGCACKLLNRDFICIDNDEVSIEVAINRIDNILDISDKYKEDIR